MKKLKFGFGGSKNKIQPIITNNPSDPRLKSYNDSLSAYNRYINSPVIDPSIQSDIDLFSSKQGKPKVTKSPNGRNLYTWANGSGFEDLKSVLPINKPVQPIIYQKPNIVTVKKKVDDSTVNLNTQYPNIQAQGSPIQVNPYTMQGHTPVYGPSNSLIGMLGDNNFYPDYDNTAKRSNVNQPDSDLILNEDNMSKYLKSKNISTNIVKYATGGEVDPSNVMGIMNAGKPILDGLLALLDENSQDYSRQPIVNASTVRNMVTPYTKFALGGTVDDLDDDEATALQQYAEENGMTPEEAFEEWSDTQNEEYAYGGVLKKPISPTYISSTNVKKPIVLNPSSFDIPIKQPSYNSEPSYNFGSFYDFDMMHPDYAPSPNSQDTLLYNKTFNDNTLNYQQLEQDREAARLSNDRDSFKAANIRRNAFLDKRKGARGYAMGGQANNNIEVEGKEVVEHPNGDMVKVQGPSHEDGGVDMNVPDGTKIYSDRLSLDGKSMAQRKLARERSLAKLQKLSSDKTSIPAKNTLKRMSQVLQIEEQQDMALQKLAGHIYGSPRKAAYGDEVNNPYIWPMYNTGEFDPTQMKYADTDLASNSITSPALAPSHLPTNPSLSLIPSSSTTNNISNTNSNNLTAGDYVGLAGNAFNAIAPIINTIKNRKATLPNINRYRGFGHDALDANDAAQHSIATQEGNALTDIDTSANSAYARNRDSARSVNTIRALDIATNMGKNKSTNAVRSNASSQISNLLTRRGQLSNQRDEAEMRGQTAADMETKADTDNYFSNTASNLTNLGINVQGIGRSLNTSQKNQDDMDLLGLLTQNNIKIGRNKNGKLVLLNRN